MTCPYMIDHANVDLRVFFLCADIFKPGRFAIHLYLDDNSAAGLNRSAGNKIGIENAYTGYRMLNIR